MSGRLLPQAGGDRIDEQVFLEQCVRKKCYTADQDIFEFSTLRYELFDDTNVVVNTWETDVAIKLELVLEIGEGGNQSRSGS